MEEVLFKKNEVGLISCYEKLKTPIVIDEIDIYTYLDFIKNPDPEVKSLIEKARYYYSKGGTSEYDKIKFLLPCHTLNFSFQATKSNDTIKKPTGFIYLDMDDCTEIDFTNPLIFASWLSLSRTGRGVLVKVSGLNRNNFKSTYEAIANELNVKVDNYANKPTQFCVHSYDEGVYINNDSITYQAIEVNINPPHSVSIKRKRKGATELGCSTNLVYDNIEDYDFKGKQFIFFEEQKEIMSKAFLPPTILPKSRNSKLSAYAFQMKALNPYLTFERLFKLVLKANYSRCCKPLEEKEIKNIVEKVMGQEEITPLLNYPRRILFSEDCKMTANEKRAITNKLNGKRRTQNTMKKIENCLINWDKEKQGNVTQKKLAEATGLSIKTIERHYKDFLGYRETINSTLN
tara:strand:- start:1892 stop:3100 length:1209 start_codon:yes stop_codon:yes gene_type:complete